MDVGHSNAVPRVRTTDPEGLRAAVVMIEQGHYKPETIRAYLDQSRHVAELAARVAEEIAAAARRQGIE